MCPQKLIYLSLVPRLWRERGFSSQRPFPLALLILFFSLALGSAFAQKQSEDYLAVKNWVLPQDATPFAELTLNNDVYMLKAKPFTGVAYERFTPKQLSRAVYYCNGKQEGLMLLWYPDGAPQMSANYRHGLLHGRFLGWYQNGGVIYDMVINKGAYAGDNLAEGDDSRSATEANETEGEGRDNDKNAE